MTKQQEFRKQTEEAKFEAFSLMCKKVTELEKENAGLKEHIKADCIDCADFNKNKKLEKENAELKKANKKLFGRFYKKGVKDYCEKEKQLAQAKELLKKIYYLYFYPCVTKQDLKNREKLFEEVKQFLNDEQQSKWVNPITTTNDPFVR